ncbi:HelD family protein [Cellulosimicrobium arenosum]|uniref:AAA family ATPase n=1 Tax=Cellulosimicrobium arenosum TaxID=2708133 RepID=A0A927GAT3_9MICO|nr:AAA family ATPase [Cellulosimicrobium arenosum]MBD8079215.1 AAA family ATPase [Cellulosimicrobium arenosum]
MDGRSARTAGRRKVHVGRSEEIQLEQTVVDRLYARLDELRSATRDRLARTRRSGPSGSPQNRSERDAFATLYEDRVAQLDGVEDRLVFGRLDLVDGETRYVGRVGLADAEHTSMLTDWRAPAAQTFYRATSARPDGAARRRHLVTHARRVTGLEDELLDLDAAGDVNASTLSGEGALLAAMTAGRTGRMGDIVATIQAEQDAIIRSALSGALVVQGGPGTGKTAVALHRAAYLLYAHRRVLERSGVLLVGPSRSFLHYIDQVLPSLGETGVVSTTLADILPGVRARAVEPPDVALVKGRAGMADVVRRAVRARERVPARDVPVRVDGTDLVIRRRDVRDAIAHARRTHKPHNLARVTFVREMLARLAEQYASAQGEPLSPEDRSVLLEDLRADRDVRVALNVAWFPITPQRLVEDLWTKPHRLVEAAPALSAADRRLLVRAQGAPWTEDDVPLLDEAAELLGEDDQAERAQAAAEAAQRTADVEYARQVLESSEAGGLVGADELADRFAASGPRLTTAERATQDRSWTYGHVVVDEAQELSAMAWRMLVRRCPTRSFTIVGDVAQTSSPAGARSWAQMLEPVLGDGWRLAELTVNYRTPTTVADAARRAALAAGLPVSPQTSARDVAGSLRVVPTTDLLTTVEREVRDARAEFVRDESGRVAVIATDSDVSALRERLGVVGAGPDTPVVVLGPVEAKGLEFDCVVLVEPARIATRGGGPGDLYVAATRPTQRLVVVHAQPLPAGLQESPASP